jgi:hypothetical protein
MGIDGNQHYLDIEENKGGNPIAAKRSYPIIMLASYQTSWNHATVLGKKDSLMQVNMFWLR